MFIYSKEEKDTIEVLISDKKGKWLGTGIGDVREIEVKFKDKKIYQNKEIQNLRIEQAMRYGSEEKISNLKNIYAVGVTVIKNHE